MEQRRIIIYGHPSLRRVAAAVADVDAAVRGLVTGMFEAMRGEQGIGLAAPQVDVGQRVVVVDPTPSGREGTRALALINPVVREYAGMCAYEEGCLSIPGIYAEVQRPERVRVSYLDAEGDERDEDFEGLMARVIQHEVDHLEGTLFVDRLPAMRRALLRRRLRELAREDSATPS